MTLSGSFFKSIAYHIVAACIYMAAGIALVLSESSKEQNSQTAIIGWIIFGYGAYRLIARIIQFKRSEKVE